MKSSRYPLFGSVALVRIAYICLILGLLPIPAAHGQASPSLRQLIYLDDSKRSSALMELSFDVRNWTVGQVVSHKPYAVVNEVGGEAGKFAYELQVWRGTVVREGSGLMTEWDVLDISGQGSVIQVFVNYARVAPNYFAAASQKEFRTLTGTETYPWADLPTDPEARARGIPMLPADGFIDVYGILPQDGSVALSSVAHQVKALPNIPSQLKETAPQPIALPAGQATAAPSDLSGHWGEPYVLDLMGKGIIKGFEDGTVQPDRKLSRAEFVALLIRALQVEPLSPPSVVYSDVPSTHWASKEIGLAYEIGIIDTDGTGRFQPSRLISRLEMARVLAAAMPSFTPPQEGGNSALKDVDTLKSIDRRAILSLAEAGIVGGNDLGEFRPEESLTRAEASKVLSQFLKIGQAL